MYPVMKYREHLERSQTDVNAAESGFENYMNLNIQNNNVISLTGKINVIHFYYLTDDALIIRADRTEKAGILL
jgi:hypothetical protein